MTTWESYNLEEVSFYLFQFYEKNILFSSQSTSFGLRHLCEATGQTFQVCRLTLAKQIFFVQLVLAEHFFVER